jgi:hypothetical protein
LFARDNTEDGIVTVGILEQPLNAEAPIPVIVLGKVILVNPLQPWNVLIPMVLIPSGMDTLVTCVAESNKLAPNPVRIVAPCLQGNVTEDGSVPENPVMIPFRTVQTTLDSTGSVPAQPAFVKAVCHADLFAPVGSLNVADADTFVIEFAPKVGGSVVKNVNVLHDVQPLKA